MTKLLKLTLRNCNLQGAVPDLSRIPNLIYLDLSSNYLTGSIPTNKLSDNMTTIDLSNNMLKGSIPSNFSGFPQLQRLSIADNKLSGIIPTTIWKGRTFSTNATLTLDFQNNLLSDISGVLDPPANVSIWLQGNSVCGRANLVQFCKGQPAYIEPPGGSRNSSYSTDACNPRSCPRSPNTSACYCATPLGVGLRWRSPSISDFRPYIIQFKSFMNSSLGLGRDQVVIDSFIWEREGPRLMMYLKLFPQNNNTFTFSELERLTGIFAAYGIPTNGIFGPYDLLYFVYDSDNQNVFPGPLPKGTSSKILGIAIGGSAGAIAISLAIAFVCYRKKKRYQKELTKRVHSFPFKTDGVEGFSFAELKTATQGFNISMQVGEGGYGNVYQGILDDGRVVAIERAQQGSLQGQKEFFTEIELLSRLHHRNLVSLLGYCVEQLGVFGMRIHIALGAAKEPSCL